MKLMTLLSLAGLLLGWTSPLTAAAGGILVNQTGVTLNLYPQPPDRATFSITHLDSEEFRELGTFNQSGLLLEVVPNLNKLPADRAIRFDYAQVPGTRITVPIQVEGPRVAGVPMFNLQVDFVSDQTAAGAGVRLVLGEGVDEARLPFEVYRSDAQPNKLVLALRQGADGQRVPILVPADQNCCVIL